MGRLTDDMTRLRGEVDALRNMRGAFIDDLKADVTDMQSGFRNNHAEMARGLRGDLVTFVSGLENSVAEMKAGFNEDHAEMARNLKDALGTFVSGLKGDVSAMKAGFNEDHAEMARNLRDALGTFVSGLKDTVGGMRKEVADDIAGARQAWSGPLPAEPKVIVETRVRAVDKEEPRAAEEPQRQEDEDEAEAEAGSLEAEEAGTAEEVIPDDLTVISGIGPARQGQLNEAGYYTFAQLAESTPEKLREILGGSARSANVENWIEDARDLAQ
ncbi:MAG: helix-hairpin-helix domain-containing protein [Pseudomonadota bacterium]